MCRTDTGFFRMSSSYNSETLSNQPNPGCPNGYCRAAPGIERVPELYPEDILRKGEYSIVVTHRHTHYTSRDRAVKSAPMLMDPKHTLHTPTY